jgi:hypothetical protein
MQSTRTAPSRRRQAICAECHGRIIHPLPCIDHDIDFGQPISPRPNARPEPGKEVFAYTVERYGPQRPSSKLNFEMAPMRLPKKAAKPIQRNATIQISPRWYAYMAAPKHASSGWAAGLHQVKRPDGSRCDSYGRRRRPSSPRCLCNALRRSKTLSRFLSHCSLTAPSSSQHAKMSPSNASDCRCGNDPLILFWNIEYPKMAG